MKFMSKPVVIEIKRPIAVIFEEKLRALCGYVEDGSATVVKISQDDATRSWCVSLGNVVYGIEDSMIAAINTAYEKLEKR